MLGDAARFGKPDSVMAAGDGIETVLSLLSLFPALPMAAALSAAHLAALALPASLHRLYVFRNNDAAGEFAEDRLGERCREAGVDCRALLSAAKDLNADLCAAPLAAVKRRMLPPMAVADRIRFRGWLSSAPVPAAEAAVAAPRSPWRPPPLTGRPSAF